ncbi:glycosyltransferase [Amylibacter sp. SFDW26]|uniref:TIGR04283 family arsenosugar biosynthesis glycosyltransferase n=1 Tax=Amylibacter sp. SFDW26 TaxID=2652722 RepID=UPI001261A6DE|nr:TIGR04283 family arsenosugar biosynthesis glycosyltransferase [Amylibacter sp. SFDW26]KAB7616181.1 glycosyltransferase [Amylibacter sp. SFDW26]
MPAPISVVIPTLNTAKSIGPTLACLYEGMGQSLLCEVIFADGGSDDGIEDVAKEVGAKLIKAPKGRGSQLSAGAQAAKGKWILFIHADTVLSDNWVSAMGNHINTETKAAYCKLKFDANTFPARFIAGCANLRSRLFGLPYGDQTLLISKHLYKTSDGYPEIPLMEDVALVRKLRGKLMSLDVTATTGSNRYIKDGWYKRAAKNLGTLARYFIGVSPEKLAERYRR